MMNRFEVLRGFNKLLMIPMSTLAILGAIMTLYTFSYVFAIPTIVFIILTFGLNATLEPLTFRIHQEYFPARRKVSKNEWNDNHKKCMPARASEALPARSSGGEKIFIPAAKLVTED